MSGRKTRVQCTLRHIVKRNTVTYVRGCGKTNVSIVQSKVARPPYKEWGSYPSYLWHNRFGWRP